MKNSKTNILFVCLGNICRSACAEAVMKKKVQEAGLEKEFFIDSAGILSYHEGERADYRMYCTRHTEDYVPDPYYGGRDGFFHVIELLEDACEGLLNSLK